jgi:hypothetical protein
MSEVPESKRGVLQNSQEGAPRLCGHLQGPRRSRRFNSALEEIHEHPCPGTLSEAKRRERRGPMATRAAQK